MRKRNDKLLISLFKNYITFVIILASIFFLAYTYLGYKMSKSMEDRGAPVLDLLHGKYDDYSKLNEDVLIKLEGFIEVLDSKRNVIHRMGKVPKYELLKDSYSEFELLQAISMSDEDERYFVLVDTVEEDNDFKTILIRVPEDKVSLAINIFSVPYSLGKPLLFKNYITFVIILASIFFLAYTYLGYKMSKSMENQGAPVLDLLHGKYDDYSKLNEDVLIKLEGFIEVLDSKRNVTHRMGKIPKDETLKDSYSEYELLETISMSDEDERYFVLVDTVEEDSDFKTILIRVPEDKVSLAINIFSVPYSLGKPLFKLFI